eukprot:1142463-Prymnesium_polylepis.1
MAHDERDEQPTSASPRVAARRRSRRAAQAAGGGGRATAVGEAVGDGGKPPADTGGTWTTVISRRARWQVGKARLDGTSSSAARRTAAARKTATRVT